MTADTTATMPKDTLRHDAIARRKQTTAAERAAAGEQLAAVFNAALAHDGAGAEMLPQLNTSSCVAAYVSMGSEIETRPLLRALLERGVRVLVPMLGAGRDLGWGKLTSLDDLSAAGKRRPDEPAGEALPAERIADADLAIVPALMVDASGYRLGRGAGWYDRALAMRSTNCPIVAVCWPWEVVDTSLPHEEHDIPADAVLTPSGFTPLTQR